MLEETRKHALSVAMEITGRSIGNTDVAWVISVAKEVEDYLLGCRTDELASIGEIPRDILISSLGSSIPGTSDCVDKFAVSRCQSCGDNKDQSLAGGKVSCTHSSSSSVLADGDNGDSVAADPRNNATPDTSVWGVNGDA
ncbi:hypothetical protein JK203_08905 [Gluconobacter cerinus]|uniref:hypothetical protein n=1 Tax=Gluconobacter cerinus TaxID=38307 RepID=UPI001B8BBCE3|nr:hypothetical protein [Gluconobacter cerinus]MBS1040967.1 hypothetical protein [Gluconobacter cerinus]MBS1047972.1 hypothetical protein [Gluconobacter cerinus]